MSKHRRKRSIKRASSLSEAFQLCLDHALAKHNRGIKRIADLMGVKQDTLYKWLAEDRMPVNMVASFENACGATYVTEYMCANAHLLAVEMPSGRRLNETDVLDLQESFSNAIGRLIRFYKGDADKDETLADLNSLLADIGWHRANVALANAPELELFGGEG